MVRVSARRNKLKAEGKDMSEMLTDRSWDTNLRAGIHLRYSSMRNELDSRTIHALCSLNAGYMLSFPISVCTSRASSIM